MASVVGALLQAELVFNFSGQWNIESYVNGDNELIYFYRNDEKRNRYYDIRDVVINSNVNVVYFYPSLCEDDIQQAQLISQMGASNICTIALKSEKHGHTVKGNNLPYIICRDKEWWEHFDKVEEGKEYSPFKFMVKSASLYNATKAYVIDYFWMIVHKIKTWLLH